MLCPSLLEPENMNFKAKYKTKESRVKDLNSNEKKEEIIEILQKDHYSFQEYYNDSRNMSKSIF